MWLYLIFLFVELLFPNQKLEGVSVSFEISHLGALTVEGRFTKVEADVTRISPDKWEITGSIDICSVDTGNSTRDETILGEQYLNAEIYPVIPFEAKLAMTDEIKAMEIDLEVRGITFQLTGELFEEGGVLISKPIAFKRSDIGLDFGLMDSLIGDEIIIVIQTGVKSWPH